MRPSEGIFGDGVHVDVTPRAPGAVSSCRAGGVGIHLAYGRTHSFLATRSETAEKAAD